MADLIDRQEALEGLYDVFFDDELSAAYPKEADKVLDVIRKLPSAQPEIIRCTECKHYREYDSEYVKNAVVVQCMADRYPISEIMPDGWFCAGAERKDDE